MAHFSQEGLALSSIQWLQLHHQAKTEERERRVRNIANRFTGPITLLDIACGPGLWFPQYQRHFPAGSTFAGVDKDAEMLQYARQHYPFGTFYHEDYLSIPLRGWEYDVTLCNNSYGYSHNIRQLLAEQYRLTRPGGYMVGRHWDNSTFLYYPMDQELLHRVLHAAHQGWTQAEIPDHYMGMKLPQLFGELEFQDRKSVV